MIRNLEAQVSELCRSHTGIVPIGVASRGIYLGGLLSFEGPADTPSSTVKTFGVKIVVPEGYPAELPAVWETGGQIDASYEHVNSDGTLCLAVPIEARLRFQQRPTLLGFVENFVVPYLYGYCCWKEHGEHPVGEREHGSEGILRYYCEEFGLTDEAAALSVILFLAEHGYRGHLDCPCESGRRVRHCHGAKLRELQRHHTPTTLETDLTAAVVLCAQKYKESRRLLEPALMSRLEHYVERKGGSRRRRRVGSVNP